MPSRKEANPPATHTLTCAPQLLGTHSTNFSERSATQRGCGAARGRDVAPSVSLHTPPHNSSRCPPSSRRKRLATMPTGGRKGPIWETYSSSSRGLWGWMPGQERKRIRAWPISSFDFPEVVRNGLSLLFTLWHTGRAGCTSLMASQEPLSFLEGNVCQVENE